MKKIALAVVFLAATGVAALPVFAADGTITLTGEITGTTCSISGGSGSTPGASPNFSVALNKVQASALNAPGQTAGSKPFFIHVSTCPKDTVVAVLYESSSPAINPATGNLMNQAPAKPKPASLVEVQIVDGTTNRPMDLRLAMNSSSATVPESGTVSLPFAAQYFATGKATPGPVSTQVLYSVTFP
ncbi:fimbrial protein [Pseudomonas sp. MWU15-20650]|uniref:fimbrial protein n=1 Tax=Pseudomonas sp. MWU15-20650 TaxID=2933107 RepID=UPI00200EF71B|nr:fimbrial protein [Pseudomonas sp. MWU15-20650]